MARKHRPQRSCVVCRTKRDKRELTRLVMTEGGLTIDGGGKMNGRGAYLCGDGACWANAAARPTMARALRQELSAADRDYLRQMAPA